MQEGCFEAQAVAKDGVASNTGASASVSRSRSVLTDAPGTSDTYLDLATWTVGITDVDG